MNLHIKPEVISIDAATVNQWMGENNVVLIDVRETSEFDQEHIPGALLQPLSVFDPELFPKVPGKNIVLHCAVGKRSEAAGKMLANEGHTNIMHLNGGIKAWKDAGFETEEQFIPPVAPEPLIKASKPVALMQNNAKITNGILDLASGISPASVLHEEFMQPLDISTKELARKIGVEENVIQQILKGAAPVTAELSLRLARYFCTAEEFWLNLQIKSDLQQANTLHGKLVHEAITPRLCD